MWKDRTIKCNDEFKLIDVTPDMALEKIRNAPPNRSDKAEQQARMSETIIRGEWYIGESMIMEDREGIKNGLNRLKAVARSGCIVTMLFRIRKDGVFSPEEIRAIDTGTNRSIQDAAAFDNSMKICSKKMEATMRMMLGQGCSFPRQTNEVFYQLELYYKDGIEFINSIFGPRRKGGITIGPVMGVFMAAFYVYPDQRHKIQKIAEFLLDPCDGFNEHIAAGMKTIWKLREELTENANAETGATRRTIYRKVEYALDQALNGIDVDVIKESKSCLFPVDIPDSVGVVRPGGNHKLAIYLPCAVKNLRDQEIIPVKTLAEKILEVGYPSKAKNPNNEVGKLISKPVKDNGVLIFSNGRLLPVMDGNDQRLYKVKFVAERE